MANENRVESRTTHSTTPIGGERIDVQRTETIERDYATMAAVSGYLATPKDIPARVGTTTV